MMSPGDHISRYITPTGSEAEFQPGSAGRVLVNRLGIRRKTDMDAAEYRALLGAQEAYVKIITPETRFTAELLCRMHGAWLGSIYDWAGRYRNVDVAKGGFRWPPAVRVAENMGRFEAECLARNTPCRPGELTEVARRMAEVHADFLLIHPFREGNGRMARWLADLMPLQAGLATPNYGFTGRGSKLRQQRYLEAVMEGYAANYEPLTALFAAALDRGLRDLGRTT
jgi:cell filamentation protein